MFALTATELKKSSGHVASMDRCGRGASGRHVVSARYAARLIRCSA